MSLLRYIVKVINVLTKWKFLEWRTFTLLYDEILKLLIAHTEVEYMEVWNEIWTKISNESYNFIHGRPVIFITHFEGIWIIVLVNKLFEIKKKKTK